MTGTAFKGHLELVILAVLQDRGLHGYALIEELRRRSEGTFDLAEGTVYPVLHKLESQRLLKSDWDESAGRRRRIYQITRRGRQALRARQEDWAKLSRGVETVLAWA